MRGAQSCRCCSSRAGTGTSLLCPLSAPAEPDLLEQLRLVDAARGEMERVSAALDVESLAAATVRDHVVIVPSSGEPRAGQSTTRVGQRMPFVAPLGTLLVAWEPPAAVQAWLDRLDPKLPERDAAHYRQLLERVRRRGWSISLASAERIAFEAALAQLSVHSPTPEQEKAVRDTAGRVGWLGHEPDDLAAGQTYPVRNVSGPIFNSDGRCILMLSPFVGRRCTGEEVEHLRDRVLQASAAVTAALGGRHPDERPMSRTTQPLPGLPRP
jgi:DNA-binding IclR family transcriptional regulator